MNIAVGDLMRDATHYRVGKVLGLWRWKLCIGIQPVAWGFALSKSAAKAAARKKLSHYARQNELNGELGSSD